MSDPNQNSKNIRNDWHMIQTQRYYVFLNTHADVIGIAYNKGDLETNSQAKTKQRWYGSALTGKRWYRSALTGNRWHGYGELDTFAEVRQLIEADLNNTPN